MGYSLISTTEDRGYLAVFIYLSFYPSKNDIATYLSRKNIPQQHRSPNCIIGFLFSQLPKWNLVFFFFFFFFFLFKNPVYFFFREEIPIALSDSFTITIPIDNSEQTTENECGEDVAICFSGQSLSSLIDPDGCEVYYSFSTSTPLFLTFFSSFSSFSSFFCLIENIIFPF